jgi:hypothetical protein
MNKIFGIAASLILSLSFYVHGITTYIAHYQPTAHTTIVVLADSHIDKDRRYQDSLAMQTQQMDKLLTHLRVTGPQGTPVVFFTEAREDNRQHYPERTEILALPAQNSIKYGMHQDNVRYIWYDARTPEDCEYFKDNHFLNIQPNLIQGHYDKACTIITEANLQQEVKDRIQESTGYI